MFRPIEVCPHDVFLAESKKAFAHPVSEGSSAKRLLILHQSNRRLAKFVTEFHTVAAETRWPEYTLQ